ncbi:MAG: hypothetical protein ACYTE8_04970 [Planctomycetota bacterium]|jgi:hypothetical protein
MMQKMYVIYKTFADETEGALISPGGAEYDLEPDYYPEGTIMKIFNEQKEAALQTPYAKYEFGKRMIDYHGAEKYQGCPEEEFRPMEDEDSLSLIIKIQKHSYSCLI